MKEYIFQKRGIYYRKNDFKSDRKTVVFIHGLSSSSSAWEVYEKEYMNSYNILTLDLRGHGKSIKYNTLAEYQIEKCAEDVIELLQELSISNCILISHSFGTFVALACSTAHQAMFEKVIFLSPTTNPRRRFLARCIFPFIQFFVSIRILPCSIKPAQHVDYTKYQGTGDWNIRRLFADISNTGLQVYLYCIRQSYIFDTDTALKKITIPTVIIHGTKDTISPVANAIYMAHTIPHSELHILKKADHIIVLNNSKEIIQIINTAVV